MSNKPTSTPPSNSSASNTTSTLYNILTGFQSTNQYEATKLIRHLLEAVAHDACLAKRNTHSLLQLMSDARDAYDHINGLIDQIELDDEISWDVFDCYTGAIGPLEDLLFLVSPVAEKESLQFFADKHELEACIDSVETWGQDRILLDQAIEQLYTLCRLFSKPERQLSHQFRDDYVFLSALNSDFKRLFGVKGSWLNGRLDVQAIQGVIQKIADTFAARSLRKSETISSEGLEVLVKSVQFTMLAHGVLEIAGSAQTSPTVQYHLRSPEVWAEGKRFADVLIAHVIPNTQKQSDSESLSTQWQRFLDFLRSNSIVPKLPKIYPGLRKHIGRIRRPYYLQALTLVNECRTLAEAFSSQTDKVKAQELLETTFADVDNALQSAATHASATQVSDIGSQRSEGVAGAFETAERSVEACLGSFQRDKELSEWRGKMERAVQKDGAQLDAFEQRLGKSNKIDPVSIGRRKLTIELWEAGPDKRAQLVPGTSHNTFEMDSSTTLNALQWHYAHQFEDIVLRDRILSPKSCFVQGGAGGKTKLDFSLTVENLSTSTLLLFIPDK